jgi:hypothetical protein
VVNLAVAAAMRRRQPIVIDEGTVVGARRPRRMLRTVLSVWLTPYRADTWRRYGYALAAVPVSVICVGLAMMGKTRAAVRYAVNLAATVAGLPVRNSTPSPRRSRVAIYGIGTLALSLASVVILQYLAYLMVTNVAYPIRGYIDFLPRNTLNAAPWDTWWGTHRVSGLTGGEGPDPWSDHYYHSWGGPTLAGAWTVHAAGALLVIYPLLAWAIRGLTALLARLTRGMQDGVDRSTSRRSVPSGSSR